MPQHPRLNSVIEYRKLINVGWSVLCYFPRPHNICAQNLQQTDSLASGKSSYCFLPSFRMQSRSRKNNPSLSDKRMFHPPDMQARKRSPTHFKGMKRKCAACLSACVQRIYAVGLHVITAHWCHAVCSEAEDVGSSDTWKCAQCQLAVWVLASHKSERNISNITLPMDINDIFIEFL